MKKCLIFILTPVLLLMLSSCGGGSSDAADETVDPVDSASLVTVKYSVEGMTCPGCENTVNYAVGELPGVTEVTSSFKEEFALVTFDPEMVTEEQIEEAITTKGYIFHGTLSDE